MIPVAQHAKLHLQIVCRVSKFQQHSTSNSPIQTHVSLTIALVRTSLMIVIHVFNVQMELMETLIWQVEDLAVFLARQVAKSVMQMITVLSVTGHILRN